MSAGKLVWRARLRLITSPEGLELVSESESVPVPVPVPVFVRAPFTFMKRCFPGRPGRVSPYGRGR